MVRNYQRKRENFNRDKFKQAVLSVKKDNMHIQTAARLHNVSRSTLKRWLKNTTDDQIESGNIPLPTWGRCKIFSNETEKQIMSQILNPRSKNFGSTSKQVRELAYRTAKKLKLRYPRSWENKKIAGTDWFSGFLKRHPNLSLQKPENGELSTQKMYKMIVVEKNQVPEIKFEPSDEMPCQDFSHLDLDEAEISDNECMDFLSTGPPNETEMSSDPLFEPTVKDRLQSNGNEEANEQIITGDQTYEKSCGEVKFFTEMKFELLEDSGNHEFVNCNNNGEQTTQDPFQQENSDQVDETSASSSVPQFQKMNNTCESEEHTEAIEVLRLLKEKIRNSTINTERIFFLSLTPKSWSPNKLIQEFGASEFEAQQLVNARGIPNSKKPKNMDSAIIASILAFYESDENSHMMQGTKNSIFIKKPNGTRERAQKRLLLCSLSELFQIFKDTHPKANVSLTAFSQLRPRNCVLPEGCGTHTKHVCVIHENIELMCEAIDLKNLTCKTEFPFETPNDALKIIICESATPECYLNECQKCPKLEILQDLLKLLLTNQNFERIEHQAWLQIDKLSLNTVITEVEDFVDEFCENLFKLKTHSFIYKEEEKFWEFKKQVLKQGECLVTCAFAEDYSFFEQNAEHSLNQMTMFTIVFYYKEENRIKNGKMVILSDELEHDAVAVRVFQKIFIDYLKENFNFNKIYYFSDGAAEFRNEVNFQNLLYHERDFGISAEWHFFASAHIHGLCDVMNGNLKRLATRASLEASGKDKILDCEAFYDWAKKNFKDTEIVYSSKESYEKTEVELNELLNSAVKIPEIQKYHSFVPIDNTCSLVGKYSSQSYMPIFSTVTKKFVYHGGEGKS